MSDLPWCLCCGLLNFNSFTKPKWHPNESMQLLFQKAFIPVNIASNELTLMGWWSLQWSGVALQVRCFLSPAVVKGWDVCALGYRGQVFSSLLYSGGCSGHTKRESKVHLCTSRGLPLWAGILHMSWHWNLSWGELKIWPFVTNSAVLCLDHAFHWIMLTEDWFCLWSGYFATSHIKIVIIFLSLPKKKKK